MKNVDKIREGFLQSVSDHFASEFDVLRIATNSIAIPIVDEEGNEGYIKVVVSVPKGSKDEEFDGYSLAEDYELKQKLKKEKAEAKKKKAEEEKKKKSKKSE